MVTRAISEGLITRIQNYIATDLNSKIPPAEEGQAEPPQVNPENVYVLSFTRVLASWSAWAVSHLYPECFYEVIHNGTTNVTIVNVYNKKTTQQAII